MTRFKEPDFKERQKAAAQAQKAALEKFRAKAADPAAAERQQPRAADGPDRAAVKQVRAAEKAERKARDTEAEKQTNRHAARAPERASAEKAKRKSPKQGGQKTARDAPHAARKAKSKKSAR